MAESTNPTKVEEQGSKADELQKEIIEGKKTPEQQKAEALAAEEKDKVKVKKKEEKETPAVTPAPTPGEGAEGFEQKYLVLQGKYDTEVPQLIQQVKDAQQTIANLNVIVDSIQKEQPVPGKEKVEDKPAAQAELKSEDFEGYGAEMIELVTLVKDQATQIKGQTDEIKTLKGQVETVSQDVSQSNEDTFYADLAKIIPDWQKINKDMAWRKWLAEIDPLTGLVRQTLLDGAFNILDAKRVATFFKTFKGDGGQPIVDTPTGDEQPAGSELEAQIVPDTTLPTETPGGPKAPQVTRAQLVKATKDYQTGRITEEQFNKIANQFQNAVAAGPLA